MSNKFKLDIIAKNIKRNENALITEVANNAKKFFLSSFDKQGWDGKSWKQVKRRESGTPEYKYPKKKGLGRRTSNILVRKGTLRRAVNNSIRSKTKNTVRFEVNLPYAEIHNSGGRMKNGKKMPKRKFMGRSSELNSQTKMIIRKWTTKSLKT